MATTYADRLSLARERIGVRITPQERASRFTPLAGTEPFAMPTAETAAARVRPAGPPPGMVANPEATNFGRLSVPRTDVAEFVPANRAPQRVSPLNAPTASGPIDVNSYAGSRYAQPAAPRPSTLLPSGNPLAQTAILRAQFPGATRGELGGLRSLAQVRPEQFNASMAGSALDPTMAGLRIEGARAGIDATRQGISLNASDAARKAAGDDFAGRLLNAPGVPASTLFQAAELALQRERSSREQPKPYETEFHGRPAVVGGGGNVTFADNDPRTNKAAKPEGEPIMSKDGRFVWRNGQWDPVKEEQPERMPSMMDLFAFQMIRDNPALLEQFNQFRSGAKKGKPAGDAAAPAKTGDRKPETENGEPKKPAASRYKVVEVK